jgi:hypothetical protein
MDFTGVFSEVIMVFVGVWGGLVEAEREYSFLAVSE